MNFWLLAFAIDYPPEIKRPELQKQATGAFTNRNRGLLSQNGKHFLHKSLPFISRASRVFGRLCLADGSRRRTCMGANIDRSSRVRGSSWQTRRLPGWLYANDRLKLRAHRRGQLVNDL